jgi:hypothetical protein
VNIWLEHDSFDQLVLAKLLDYFSDASRRPPRLRFIIVTQYPGIERFIGLGQLPPEALRVLWNTFRHVTEAQLAVGKSAWEAITSRTPELLEQLVNTATPALPTMSGALARHLRELPSLANGLSLTEHLTLQILREKGALSAGRLFGAYTNEYEPLPFLGDSGYWVVLNGLATAQTPALQIKNEPGSGIDRHSQIELLPFGQHLLDSRADWLAMNRAERWVGGVHIDSRQPQNWRIDERGNVLLTRSSAPNGA